VARLIFRAVIVALGKMRAVDLLQMVVFGEIGSDPSLPSVVSARASACLHPQWTRLD
jgi:hypothetical protein